MTDDPNTPEEQDPKLKPYELPDEVVHKHARITPVSFDPDDLPAPPNINRTTFDQVKTGNERARICCLLNLMPTMMPADIAEHLGIKSAGMVKQYIHTGRVKLNMPGKSDLWPEGLPKVPDADELRWRFRNQRPEVIIKRFGPESLMTFINDHDLLDETPTEVIEMLHGHKPIPGIVTDEDGKLIDGISGVRKAKGKSGVYILDTEIYVETISLEEEIIVRDLVDSFRETMKIPNGGWQIIKVVIDLRLQYDRLFKAASEQAADGIPDPKRTKELADINHRILESTAKIRSSYPERTGEDAFQLFNGARLNARRYLEERGWRQSFACPECGTIQTAYLPIYRNLIDFMNWCRTVSKGDIISANAGGLKRAALAILDEFDKGGEHPYLKHELRQLGIQWSQSGYAALRELQDAHPEITDKEISEVIAAFLEISPVAVDPDSPFSPIRRVRVTEHGKTVVESPQV